MSRKVDVVIIGAGSAGLSAWSEIKKKTQNVVMINSGPYGTTCARVGCMPSKVLIQSASDYHRRKKFGELGIEGAESLTINVPEVLNRVRSLRDRFVKGVLSGGYKELGERNIEGHAKIVAPNTVEVNGERIEAKTIVIATGTSPRIPKEWGLSRKDVLTSDEIFELKDFPKRVAVIGLGVIALELGQAMSRLGVEVCMIGRGKRIGGLTDPDLNEYAYQVFKDEFPVWVDKETKFKKLDSGKINVTCGDNSGDFDSVFAGVGRKLNTTNLGLENLGVKLDARGLPKVDPKTSKVEGLSVYLAGDLTGDRALLHEASDEGRIAGFNAVNENPQCFVRRTPMGVTFSAPNIAFAGKTFKELDGTGFVTGEVSFEGQGRSLVMARNKGILKVYGDPKTGKLLGAEMIAPSGEHLAHLLAWAIQKEFTVTEALRMPFYHPVVEEGLRTALRDLSHKIPMLSSNAEIAMCETHPESLLD